ncbi:MAG: 50S ribosomal protein L6 [candidate division TM6 bacterium GW2011_GWE2_41_16]|nr:MAG: 50S ribosomal protein L6 [candidate division TM6 bacterium GW2011_GWE2_41_16]
MSKIGRRPIAFGDVKVSLVGSEVHYTGKMNSGVYVLPEWMEITLNDKTIAIKPGQSVPGASRLWGMHRALMANALIGADKGFEKQIRIVGLGFKAVKTAKGLQFSLGFSHKIDFEVPAGLTIEIDKTGQLLSCKSTDKNLLGLVCSKIRLLRAPEPYKGTGVQYANETIFRKVGKTK